MYFTGNSLDVISPRRENHTVASGTKRKKRQMPNSYYLDGKTSNRRKASRDEFSRSTHGCKAHKKSKRQMEYELFVKKIIFALVAAGTITAGAATTALTALFGHECDDNIQIAQVEELAIPIEDEYDKDADIFYIESKETYSQNKTLDAETINEMVYEKGANDSFVIEAKEDIIESAPMVMPDDVSDDVIDALKGWETFRPEAYLCPSGKLTIGWGHTKDVYEGQTTTVEEAEEFLRQDIKEAKDTVTEYAKTLDLVLTQGQFDALVSFAYNCGINRYMESGVTELIADGDIDSAADLMRKYVKGKVEIKDENGNGTGEYEYVVMGGLVARREMETVWLYK